MEWSRRPVPAPGRDAFFAGPVRVTRVDGSILLLDNVTLSRDSVVGRQYAEPRARVALATGEVRSVHARRENALATVALVALGAVAALGAYGAAMIATIGTGS